MPTFIANLDYLNGKFNIVLLTIADANEQYVMDSITLISALQRTAQPIIKITSFKRRAKYKLTKKIAAISNSLSNYYDTNSSSKKRNMRNNN
jgi:hypothetical protein